MQRRTRIPRILIGGFLAAMLVSISAAAQSGPTGNWTGTYSYSIQVSGCQNKTFSSNGNVALTLFQVGSSLSGRIDLTNLLVFNGNCSPTNQELTNVVLGAVTGSAVAWRFPNDPNGTQFSGTISGSTITAQISDSFGGSGSLTITRTAGDAPAVDVTGAWSGNYSFTDRCSNGSTKSYTGTFTLGVTQSGGKATGVVTMQNVPLYDQNCSTIALLNMSLTVAGVVSGSTFTGDVYDPSGSFEFPITATIAGTAMNGKVQGASLTSTAGTFTLSRSSSTAPASDFFGSYDGSYTEVDNDSLRCINVGDLDYDGTASISLVQAGNAVSGSLTFEDALDVSSDGFGDCVVVNAGEEVLPLYGTLSGNSLMLQLPLGGGAAELITATINADSSISGTIVDSFGDQASFTTTKSAGADPPVINSFQAAASTIGSGESTTLTWSTSNAGSVSIDNGVGSQPVSGSVTVSPTQTTTYTLTATGAGSVTAQTTVTISPPGPRRRPTRS